MFEKTVEYSKTEQVHLIQPSHLNGGNRLFGGALLNWIDEVAAIVAMRHAGVKTVTTASIDQLQFKAGAYLNDLIVLVGYVVYTGKTSMEVRVDTYVENHLGERRRINNAHFMMVALDENDMPIKVPRLIIQTDDEREGWAHGEERRRIRIQRKKDKLDGF